MMKIAEPNYKWAHNPGNRSTTTHLILHHVAAAGLTTPETIHRWHLANGWAGIAYHYYVRKDGTICRGRPEAWSGGHTTNWNWCSIGICFEGNFEVETMPEAQRKAGAELVADIRKRYPAIIIGKHSQYQATACPGKNFPFDEIVSGKSDEPAETDAEKDPEPSEWAKASCDKAVASGLIKGDTRGNMGWKEPITKEMFAVLADRLGLLDK